MMLRLAIETMVTAFRSHTGEARQRVWQGRSQPRSQPLLLACGDAIHCLLHQW